MRKKTEFTNNGLYAGVLITCAIGSIWQDCMGKERYIQYIQEDWVSASFTVPMAIAVATLGLFLLIASYWAESRPEPQLQLVVKDDICGVESFTMVAQGRLICKNCGKPIDDMQVNDDGITIHRCLCGYERWADKNGVRWLDPMFDQSTINPLNPTITLHTPPRSSKGTDCATGYVIFKWKDGQVERVVFGASLKGLYRDIGGRPDSLEICHMHPPASGAEEAKLDKWLSEASGALSHRHKGVDCFSTPGKADPPKPTVIPPAPPDE